MDNLSNIKTVTPETAFIGGIIWDISRPTATIKERQKKVYKGTNPMMNELEALIDDFHAGLVAIGEKYGG